MEKKYLNIFYLCTRIWFCSFLIFSNTYIIVHHCNIVTLLIIQCYTLKVMKQYEAEIIFISICLLFVL
jgi:hypothetical protein